MNGTKERILYLECNSGISGDMTVGALLDLGADKDRLVQALDSMKVDGYHLHFGRKAKCGIDAFDFDVHLEEEDHDHHHHGHEEGHDHHHHDHEEGRDHHHHGHEEGHDHDHHGHEEDHDHDHHHGHEEDHDHHHSHEDGHHHHHAHRGLREVTEIIDRMEEKDSVKAMAKKMFDIVAEAESKAHGIPAEEVHFHEVGAVDSIIDIVSTAVLMDDLQVDKVIVSPLAEGHGYVRCQHGVMPVPVPATANIAQSCGLILKATDNEGEMVTPTGAAIAAAYHCGEKLPAQYRIIKTGLGAGNKDFKQANVLRAMILEPVREEEKKDAGWGGQETLWVMETNVDDCSGEALGYTMERLFKLGAADAWFVPAFMKKNRPAYVLRVLCTADKIEAMEDEIFASTTTIGIRRYPVERTVLTRRKERIATEYGEIDIKVCSRGDKTYCYPEYESVKKICEEQGIGYEEAYHLARKAAEKK